MKSESKPEKNKSQKQNQKSKPKSLPYQEFKGSNLFRLKIAYAFLLNRPIRISEIRSDSTNPGMTPYEISFLKLV